MDFIRCCLPQEKKENGNNDDGDGISLYGYCVCDIRHTFRAIVPFRWKHTIHECVCIVYYTYNRTVLNTCIYCIWVGERRGGGVHLAGVWFWKSIFGTEIVFRYRFGCFYSALTFPFSAYLYQKPKIHNFHFSFSLSLVFSDIKSQWSYLFRFLLRCMRIEYWSLTCHKGHTEIKFPGEITRYVCDMKTNIELNEMEHIFSMHCTPQHSIELTKAKYSNHPTISFE